MSNGQSPHETKSLKEELKPCLFCGGEGEIDEMEGRIMSGHYTVIDFCNRC